GGVNGVIRHNESHSTTEISGATFTSHNLDSNTALAGHSPTSHHEDSRTDKGTSKSDEKNSGRAKYKTPNHVTGVVEEIRTTIETLANSSHSQSDFTASASNTTDSVGSAEWITKYRSRK